MCQKKKRMRKKMSLKEEKSQIQMIKSPPRGTKILSDIYQRSNFVGARKYKETIKHDV